METLDYDTKNVTIDLRNICCYWNFKGNWDCMEIFAMAVHFFQPLLWGI